MPSVLRAVSAAALAALMAGAIWLGPWQTLAVAGLTVILIAATWPQLLGTVQPAGASIVIVVAAAIGAALFAVGSLPSDATAIVVAIAALVFGSLVWQLTRRDGRPGLVRSVVGTVAGGVLALMALAWQPLAAESLRPVALLALGALAAACLVRAIPGPPWLIGVIGFLLAAAAAVALAGPLQVDVRAGGVLGGAIGLLVAIVVSVGGPFDTLGRWRGLCLAAALPLATTGVVTLFASVLLPHVF